MHNKEKLINKATKNIHNSNNHSNHITIIAYKNLQAYF